MMINKIRYLERILGDGSLEGAEPDLGAGILVDALVKRKEVNANAGLEAEAIVHPTKDIQGC